MKHDVLYYPKHDVLYLKFEARCDIVSFDLRVTHCLAFWGNSVLYICVDDRGAISAATANVGQVEMRIEWDQHGTFTVSHVAQKQGCVCLLYST